MLQIILAFTRIGQFFRDIFLNIKDGFLFIGGPLDILVALIDIAATSFILYYLLKLLRDSRAWQLLKGIMLILFLAMFSSALGLSSLGYVLNRTISVLAIAIVVIFQPELRRALETVGRSSFNLISQVTENNYHHDGHTYQLIESIVKACEEMASTKTGALIVIERTTPLGDLKGQENAISLDGNLSATFLKQIFYHGSPLHDGAVLIRDGKIAAARVHIPLSDNYHLRRDLGTRHRAAIGASEMGDTVAIACSEERGTISIAIDGRLYILDNADALRTQLHRLLIKEKDSNSRFGLFKRSGQNQSADLVAKPNKKIRFGLIACSVLISLVLWFFVQIQVNPIQTKTYQVPLQYESLMEMRENGYEIQYEVANIQVTLKARKSILDKLTIRDIKAYVDLSQIKGTGINYLKVEVNTRSSLYTRVENLTPGNLTFSVRPIDLLENAE